MIDICLVIYRNYDLLWLQISQLKSIFKTNYRLLVCDNTPKHERKILPELENTLVYVLDGLEGTTDGVSHGSALDFLVKQSQSNIVGILDSDCFWLKNVLPYVIQKIEYENYTAIGVSPHYEDFLNYVDTRYPERKASLAPCVFAQFLRRDFALSETFVVTSSEGANYCETGWRHRDKLIKQKHKTITFQGFQYENKNIEIYNDINISKDVYYYNHEDEVLACHFLKGSSSRSHLTHLIPIFLNMNNI